MNLEPAFRVSNIRIRFSLLCVGSGLFLFIAGTKPNWFGWSRAALVGFIQIAVFLIFSISIFILFPFMGGYI